ncbi:MAG TPA: phospholipid carrier-dependent glycosyltransferase [Thermogutta sp.]|nr:phospholipid carrier-dependent glycosyltransferase [Thermogutta sp.]
METRGQIGRLRTMGHGNVLVLLLLTAVFRAVVLLWPGAFTTDPDSYQRVAQNLASRGIFALNGEPTAYRPPLYPVVLSGIMCAVGPYWRIGLGIIHWLFGIGTVLCVIYLVRRRSCRVCALAVLFVIADPILLHHSRLIMTETQSVFLVAVTLALFHAGTSRAERIWWFFGGVFLGLCSLTRPTFLPWPILAVLLWLLGSVQLSRDTSDMTRPSVSDVDSLPPKAHGRRLAGVGRIGLAAIGFAVAIVPWGVRNWLILGRPIIGTTHGGYTFYLANNPWYYKYLRQPGVKPVWDATEFNAQWVKTLEAKQLHDELAADRLAYELAFETIRHQLTMFLRACYDRFCQLWRLIPNRLDQDEPLVLWGLRHGVGLFYLVEYVLVGLGILGWLKRRDFQTPDRVLAVLVCALVLTVVGIHLFYWTNMRMRAPLIPMLALLAGEGYHYLTSRRLETEQT